jgi:hypothetical protein
MKWFSPPPFQEVRNGSKTDAASLGGKRTSNLTVNEGLVPASTRPDLLLDGELGPLVPTSADCAQTTEQDADDDPHHPIITLKELENAQREKNHADERKTLLLDLIHLVVAPRPYFSAGIGVALML